MGHSSTPAPAGAAAAYSWVPLTPADDPAAPTPHRLEASTARTSMATVAGTKSAAAAAGKSTLWIKRAALATAALVVLAGATILILHAAKVSLPFWPVNKDEAGTVPTSTAGPTDTSSSTADTTSTTSTSTTVVPPSPTPIMPSSKGVYFGAHVWGDGADWFPPSPSEFNSKLGITASGFSAFVYVDANSGLRDPDAILKHAEQVRAAKATFMMLTVEPTPGGLDMMTDSVNDKIAELLQTINTKYGLPLFVRFAHEMNGIWYSWSQQPDKYKSTWIRFAKAVRAKAPSTTLVWAPNAPLGYPWSGSFGAKPGSADYRAMDTNGDGTVNALDDPFLPYYPGSDWVDWIGVSAFWYGNTWGNNELPTSEMADNFLFNRQGSIVAFANKYNKPFGVFEGGASYYPKGNTPAGTKSAVAAQLRKRQVSTNGTNPDPPAKPSSTKTTSTKADSSKPTPIVVEPAKPGEPTKPATPTPTADPAPAPANVPATAIDAAIKRAWLKLLLDSAQRARSKIALLMWFEVLKTEEGGLVRDFALTRDGDVAARVKGDLGSYALALGG
ncbi:hypothetical protein GGF31_008499 [Allomyces arbusculus]|nr:hypothetical protein GGF31_008499 [Allomyces arbusculus]